MKRIVIILFLICGKLAAQQVTDYTQYLFAGVLVNPAYTGSENALSAGILHREQWLRIEGAPETNCLFVHSPLKNKSVNLGVIIEQQKYGITRHTRYNFMYAYRVRVGEGKLSLGLSGGLDDFANNWNQIVTTSGMDPRFNEGEIKIVRPLFAAGGVYNTDRYNAGVSFPQLFTGNKIYGMVVVTAGIKLPVNEDLSFSPNVLVRRIPQSGVQMITTACLTYKGFITAGISYNMNTASGFLVDLRCNPQLNCGYAYTRFTNRMNTFTGGTHELMIRYTLKFKVASISSR